MIRNWETIRTILLRLEKAETANSFLNSKQFDDLPEQEVAYNMRLLVEGGFIEAQIIESSSGDCKISLALAKRLTWKGHELLDSIRSETVWTQVKDTFKSKGIEMTFGLVFDVAKNIMSKALGLE